MAGRTAAGVICEVMRDDGEMARVADLEAFAATHGLGIVQIADLIHYRLAQEQLVHRLAETAIRPRGHGLSGTYRACLFGSDVEQAEYLALCLGDIASGEPVLVRVQVANLVRDLFSLSQPGSDLPASDWLARIEREGRGVMLYILPHRVRCLAADLGAKQIDNDPTGAPLRDIGLGSQVLVQLGIRSMRLLTNHPRRLAGIEGFGIQIVDCVPSGPSAEVIPFHEREAQ